MSASCPQGTAGASIAPSEEGGGGTHGACDGREGEDLSHIGE
jgi:hypothetical protein